MAITAALEDVPKPIWVLLMILGFMAWWPIGLVILAVMIGGRRMGCWNHDCSDGHWERHVGRWQSKIERMQEKMDRLRSRMDSTRSGGGPGQWWGQPRSSGNRAFDQYRQETLRRLEEEQREFKEFLERLRFAKDRAEFDEFMNERRNRSHDQGPQPQTN